MINAQPLSTLPEADLVDMAIAGSAPAFGELAERHRERLRRHFWYRTGSEQDADDLTQETFAKAWGAIGRFRRTSSPFVAWLMRIAHNLLVDRARGGRAYREVSFVHPVYASWEGRGGAADTSLILIDEDRAADPAAMAELAWDVARLRRALATIDEPAVPWLARKDHREVVERAYLGGQSYERIAGDLGITEGNARVRAHRGVLALRRLLAEPAGVAS